MRPAVFIRFVIPRVLTTVAVILGVVCLVFVPCTSSPATPWK